MFNQLQLSENIQTSFMWTGGCMNRRANKRQNIFVHGAIVNAMCAFGDSFFLNGSAAAPTEGGNLNIIQFVSLPGD